MTGHKNTDDKLKLEKIGKFRGGGGGLKQEKIKRKV